MIRRDTASANSRATPTSSEVVRLPVLWSWLACLTALLAGAASLVGLLVGGRIYGKETVTLADAATAQDIVTLLVLAPLLAFLSLRARAGSVSAFLCLPGALAFTTYNYLIYSFSIHFGPLFLVWVATLGLSIFGLVGGLATADTEAIKRRFTGRRLTGTAVFLVVVAVIFALLWLSEIVPDLLAGSSSRSADEWKTPTNPVHVLDLSFFLPAVIISGFLLKRRHPFGYATAAGQLVWLALTCLPILVTPLVADARGHAAGWAVTVPIGALLVAILAVLGRLFRPRPIAANPDAVTDHVR